MFKKMLEKRAELKATLSEKKGLQKGFTLIEMLVVLLILAVLIAVLVMQFGFLSKVDGTELLAESKNVESAILQVALADSDRNFPGVDTKGTGAEKVARVSGAGTSNAPFAGDTAGDKTSIIAFMIENGGTKEQATKVFDSVAQSAGLDPEELAQLVAYTSTNVDKSIAGNAKAEDYLVVVKKAQIDREIASSGKLASYSDELAGTVFSNLTVKDSDGNIYNGTNTVKE